MENLKQKIMKIFHQKHYEQAISQSEKLLKIATDNNNELYKAYAVETIGLSYFHLQKYSEAEPFLLKTVEYYKKNNDLGNLSETRNMLAICYARLQKSNKSKKLFEENAEYYKSIKNIEKTIASLLNITNIIKLLGKVDSIKIFEESLEILKKEKLPQMIPMLLVNLGNTYFELNDIQNAIEHLNSAIFEAKKNKNQNVLARAYDALAGIYFKMNKFKEALEKEEIAFAIIKKNYDRTLFINIQLNRARILFSLNNSEKSLEILNTIFEDVKNLKNLRILSKFFLFKSKIYESKQKFKNAYYALLEHNKYSRQIKENTYKISNETQGKIKKIMQELKNEQKKVEDIKLSEKQKLILIQKSKLESLGKLAAGIAHEINQPLGAIIFGLDNIYFRFEQNKLSKDYLKEKCRVLKHNLSRIDKIISQMRTFSQTQNFFKMEKLNVNQIIRDLLMLLQTQYKNHNINLKVDLNDDIGFTVGSKNQLEQVIINFLSNAHYAVNKKYENLKSNTYKKEIYIRTFCDEKKIYIEVKDNGIGISQENLFKIFDPFFTTKDIEHGTGLGLSISLGIIKRMQGKIEFISELNKYTIAKITLPKFIEKK